MALHQYSFKLRVYSILKTWFSVVTGRKHEIMKWCDSVVGVDRHLWLSVRVPQISCNKNDTGAVPLDLQWLYRTDNYNTTQL
jgi:hypothetical protein